MSNFSDNWTPGTAIWLWRLTGLLLLAALWLFGQSGLGGVVLLLVLAMTTAARQRFHLPTWTVLLDQAACLGAVAVWPQAWYALALPVFEALLAGRMRVVLPALLAVIAQGQWELPLLAVWLQAGLAGWVCHAWRRQLAESRREADRERGDRYELEQLRRELLLANVRTARLAELSERSRIAAELHDHAGHELTAAALAFQAFEQLWKENDPQAEPLFQQAVGRLSNSTRYLRDTVHAMIPTVAVGVKRLEELCETFAACPIRFQVYGDSAGIPVYHWTILEPCLKEALTNVARHSQATLAEVALDVNEHIVRLSVRDNGIGAGGAPGSFGDSGSAPGGFGGAGAGLRNLRQRARAVGGNLSVDAKKGFHLVCVLPLKPKPDKLGVEPDNAHVDADKPDSVPGRRNMT